MKLTGRLLYTDNNNLYDFLGNSIVLDKTQSIRYIFDSIDQTPHKLPLEQIDYDKFSIIINQEKGVLFNDVEKIMLCNMTNIEIVLLQCIIGRQINENDYELWCNYLETEQRVRNGNIDNIEYESELSKLKHNSEFIFNSIQIMSNVELSNQIMLDEFRHGEFRLIDCYNSQITNIKKNYANNKLQPNYEVISYSIYTDNAGFCIQDFIKAIYKQLDIITKMIFYINDLDNIQSKIPMKFFDNIGRIINSWDENNEKQIVIKLIKKLKILTLIRNEITHNTSFHTIRQPVFVGNGTECISNLPLLYSDMMFWDYDEGNIYKSNGRIGFYKNKRNALDEMHELFNVCIELNYRIIKHKFKDLVNRLTKLNITRVNVWDRSNQIPQLIPIDTEDLLNYFIDIDFNHIN